MSKIKAVTFDLWDTLLCDDTDEPKRKSAGRLTKREERRMLVHALLEKQAPIDRGLVDAVYDVVDAAFNRVWHELAVTWTVRERLDIILKGLRRELPERDIEELTRLHEEMELEFRPGFAPGVHDALRALRKRYRLGIISDAIFSPGRTLRIMLAGEGLLELFDGCYFSDEVGRAKPDPAIFLAAAKGLGVPPAGLIHIGDREHNDVQGAINVGARAVLCTAVIDRGSGSTKAAAVFKDFRELPDLISKLDR